ncbi:MAG: hypothetical protein MUO88_14995, partial [Desulfobacterales bacterium]|nr:hypothetical protein [Desulfobacterales bacterium]
SHLARTFHVCEAFICPDNGISATRHRRTSPLCSNKALRGTAVVFYCKPLITKQMGISDMPGGLKFLRN